MANGILDLQNPKNVALIQAVAAQVFSSLTPAFQTAVNAFCDARFGQGTNQMGSNGSCGCNGNGSGSAPIYMKNGGPSPIYALMPGPGTPSTVPGGPLPYPQYPPNPGCNIQPPLTPTSQSQQGLWNCQTVALDLAQCDIDRIQREGHLVTFQAELAGPLSAGDLIAVEIAPERVSHQLCVDELDVFITTDDDPPIITPITIGQVNIQAENIYQNGNGAYQHAWTYFKSDRPTYVNVTSSRCSCYELCTCVPAEAHARVYFELPQAVSLGDTLTVRFWGRRKDWQSVCGSCPVCLICDHELLTAEELASQVDTLYVIP